MYAGTAMFGMLRLFPFSAIIVRYVTREGEGGEQGEGWG